MRAFWLLALVVPTLLFAAESDYQGREEIEKLMAIPEGQVQERLEIISASLKGKDFGDGPLGEGARGKIDQDTLSRVDKFDCTTYVETVLAIALSQDWESFKKNIDGIRYENGNIGYTTRNHFIEKGWITNNAKLVEDVTKAVGRDVVKKAEATIKRKAWYASFVARTLKDPTKTTPEQKAHLEALLVETANVKDELADLDFIPFTALVGNQELLDAIPSGVIVNYIRHERPLEPFIGTNMIVTHQGFLIRKDGKLYARHASQIGDKKVIDIPLLDYIAPYVAKPGKLSPEGINLLKVN